MKPLIVIVSLITSIVLLAVAFAQRRELASLKTEQSNPQPAAETSAAVVESVANAAVPSRVQPSPSSELLRLRGEVGQLERRKRELSGARTENERLRTQLATKSTNAPGGIALPAGYMRKADAKLAGFNTPEDTIQTMLWAIQNRDAATFVQVFNPEMAQQMEHEIQRRGSAEEFFKEASVMPGLRIIGKESETADTVTLTVEMIPGDEIQSQKIHFKQFDGQWKMISGL